jgi:GxxExxY protein
MEEKEEKIKLVKENIKNAAETVMDVLGPGLSISTYTNAFLHEIAERGFMYELGKKIIIPYKGVRVGEEEIQIVVRKNVMVEIRSYKTMVPIQDTVLKLKMMIQRTPYKHYVVMNFEPASEKTNGNVRVVTNED